MPDAAPANPPPAKLATRGRGKLLALFAATVLAVYVCYLLITPFAPAMVWSATLAIVTRHWRRWLSAHVASRTWTAALGVGAVTAALLVPVGAAGYVAVKQTAATIERWNEWWNEPKTQQEIADWLEKHPWLADASREFERSSHEINVAQATPRILERLRLGATAAIAGPMYIAVQTALMLFFLFFLYRDEDQAIGALRSLMPLGERETDDLFTRVVDTIDATVYGKFAVAVLQGVLMGLMFWIVGLSGAVMWGAVMAMLAIIPYLGTFVVWAPAACYFALQGDWTRAAVLAVWGSAVVGTVDNLVYPMLVHNRLRQHTAVALMALLGGIAVFGMTGLVLGPLTVTVLAFLLDVWRRRTEGGRAAES